ncbi:glycosyltransferase family 1 protein [Ramlibacter sp. WS9]|uniref:glycosyltransferase family 4 protein n=1 Tax=Ramlibacter sp. WS9 TaxID=1882741 RepID=UPI001144D246|nr:glycosyltransferase family 1 protein [Ramlibacter sp. WS9]ROZ77456.1 glycosyltransferase family 1 protein [Ramlibacter sp. WS9]
MTTVWLHVSTLMNWDRPPVGIVRVEREYCLWLLARAGQEGGETARFCIYDRQRKQFTEVSEAAVRARLQLPATAPLPPQPHGALARAELSGWKLRAKRAWQRTKPYLPDDWVPVIARSVRGLQHRMLQERDRMRARAARREYLQAQRQGEPHGPPPAAFERGDRWISLGADWEYLNSEALYRVKRELGLRVTLICYDTIPVLFPQLFVGVLSPGGFGSYLAELAWCADSVLCISECTRRDFESVMKRLGAPVPPTHVVTLGSEIRMGAAGGAPPGLAHGPDARPFVLYVSTIERRKNHEVLYRAWSRLRDQGIVPHRLVFVGMQGWGVNDLMNDLKLDPRTQDDIVCLNHVSDGELAWLYRHAAFTVFPSLYEGWGLPVVESLAWGKFCLASSAASLPEAGGPWAEYLDPWDLPAWVDRLGHYMRHPEEVRSRNDRIAREFRAPAWAQTAQAIHDVVLSAPPQE